MTDRHREITVMLDDEYRIDDLEETMNAISEIKKVSRCEPGNIYGYEQRMAIEHAKIDLRGRVLKLIEPD